jgi:hypothetical protein
MLSSPRTHTAYTISLPPSDRSSPRSDTTGFRQPWTSSTSLLTGAVVAFALALRLASFTGLIGSDDLRYARYARAVMEGHYAQTLIESSQYERIHHGLRYGIILPLAAVYRVFGVSEWSTVMLPLLASTASVLLLAAIARRLFDSRVALIAALLYATFPMQLRLASILVPEPIAECFVLLAVLAYLHGREHERSAAWLAAGAMIGAAYLAKETAVFVGASLVLHAAWERRWRGAILVGLGLTALIAAEHAYYLFGQGDIFFRTHSTHIEPNFHRGPSRFSWTILMSLFFVPYAKIMLVPGVNFGLHSLVCLILAAAALTQKPRRSYALLLLWAAIPWLYLTFGSSSLQTYSLLPREPRYIEFTYPPLIILSAITLKHAFERRLAVRRCAAVLLGIVMLTGVASALATRGHIARAEEMTLLREIARAAGNEARERIYTEERRWHGGLTVFNASLVTSSADTATLLVVPDALGFPTVRRPSGIKAGGDRPPQR